MKYIIEKGISLENSEFPFNEMQVGDSIFVPWPEAKKARANVMHRNRLRKTHWSTRTATDTATRVGGLRIWRTE